MNKTIYHSPGHRNVAAESPNQAAEVFALRKGRRAYGRAARVGALRVDGYTRDGRVHIFQAFIGYPAEGGGTCGHDVTFNVYRV